MFGGYLNQSFFYLLLAVNVSVVGLFLIARVRRLQQQLTLLETNNLQESNHLKKNFGSMLRRLRLLEQQVDRTAQKQDELKPNAHLDTSLTQANKLLDLGIDKDQLVEDFGLSEAEANLMSLLRNKPSRIGTVA